MKNIFFLLSLVLLANVTMAQTSAGSFFVGGSAAINREEGSFAYFEPFFDDFTFAPGDITTATFLPQFGYFVADNIAIGLNAGITSIISKSNDDVPFDIKVTDNLIVVAPYIRYYKMFNDNFGLIGEFRPSFGFGSSKQDIDGDEIEFDNSTVIDISIRPGLVYFPHPKFGIEASFGALSFNSFSFENSDDSDTSFNINLTPSDILDNGSIGFNFYF